MQIPLFPRWTLRALAAGALCLTAAACTNSGDGSMGSLEQSVAFPVGSHQAADAMALAPGRVSHNRPLASLPEGVGRIGAVRTHDYVNGLRQDVLLDGSPVKGVHNGLTIVARTSNQSTLDESVPLYKPVEAGIRSEIGGAFPHIAMQISERESSNAYGPYGLALGRVGADVRCLYMWQWVDANRLPPDAGVEGPVSIRVRFCRAGTTFDDMAALTDHLTIGGAAAVDDAVAQGDIHIISAPVEADAAPTHAARRAPHRKVAHHAKRTNVARADVEAPEPEKMHYVTATSVEHAAPRVPAPAAAMPAPTPLSSDLPAEAYGGPKASAFKASVPTSY